MSRQNLAVGSYTEDQVSAALLTSGRVVSYSYELLDSNNVSLGLLSGVVSGSKVSHNYLADSIKRTASFTINEAAGDQINYLTDRIRPWFNLQMPDGGTATYPLGVFVLSSPSRNYLDGSITRSVDAYDQTQILIDDVTEKRYFIADGTLHTDAIATLLAPYPFDANIVPGDSALSADRTFDPGTTKLAILQWLLTAAGYGSPWFDGYGVINCLPYVAPADDVVSWTYSTDSNSVMGTQVSQTLDLFAVPNVFTRVVSQPDKPLLVSTYINDNPASPTSTVSRGRNIVDFQSISDNDTQATLNAITKAAAVTASQVYETVTLNTVNMPFHEDRDILQINHTNLGVSDQYSETAWEMNLQVGGVMTHSVRKVVDVDTQG